jgi:hypothetical protein
VTGCSRVSPDVDTELAQYVHPMIASLFERFGATGLSVNRVAAELERSLR